MRHDPSSSAEAFKRALAAVAFLIPVIAHAACDTFDKLPPAARLIHSEEIHNPNSEKLSRKFTKSLNEGSLYITLSSIGKGSGLVSVSPSPPKRWFSPYCSTADGVFEDKRLNIFFSLGGTDIDLNVTVTPGVHVKLEVYSLGKPASSAKATFVPTRIRVPIEVFVLDGAPLADKARNHVDSAAAIWEKAGVVLDPKFRSIPPGKTVEILGPSNTLKTYLGCSQRFDEPGFGQRERLRKEKSKLGAIGVFFVQTSTQSQAEREMLQAYLSNDPLGAPTGRTLAHELGHLLLGEGHVGGQRSVSPCTLTESSLTIRQKEPAPWTSGLMRDGATSTATDISDADALIARRAGLQIPGATWW